MTCCLYDLYMLDNNFFPTLLGFVFVTSRDDEVDGFKNANVAFFRAHNYIKSITRSNYKAFSFITDVSYYYS